jgi:hypothetical protein
MTRQFIMVIVFQTCLIHLKLIAIELSLDKILVTYWANLYGWKKKDWGQVICYAQLW